MKSDNEKLFLSQNLQWLIKTQSLTQARVARKIGMNSSTLHGYCNGVIPRHVEGLFRLAQHFNRSLDSLLSTDLSKADDLQVTDSKNLKTIEGRYEVTIRLVDTDITDNRNAQSKRT